MKKEFYVLQENDWKDCRDDKWRDCTFLILGENPNDIKIIRKWANLIANGIKRGDIEKDSNVTKIKYRLIKRTIVDEIQKEACNVYGLVESLNKFDA